MNDDIANYILGFEKLSIKVKLGLSVQERKNPQDIYLSLKLYFPTPPNACFSDDITDTICYHTLSEVLKEFCVNKEFKLIEFLTYQFYQLIRKDLAPQIKIWLKLDKHPESMPNLLGPVSFIYHDLK